MSDVHAQRMQQCLDLAARGRHAVSPNPMVGCLVYSSDDKLLGTGWHRRYGGDHAEVDAIRDAIDRHGRDAVQGGAVYVNLEPCNHLGKTPPCTELLLSSGVARVVIGLTDPNPEARGGIESLRGKGLDVIVGIEQERCYRLNEGFYSRVARNRPMVTVKIAQTLDGFIATTTGESQWITGEPARRRVHEMRAAADIVLTGTGTARADNPRLTIRHVEGEQPVRMVLDTRGELDASMHLFSDDFTSNTIAVVGHDVHPSYENKVVDRSGRVWHHELSDGRVPLNEVLARTGREGGTSGQAVNEVLVEAGPTLIRSLIESDLVDRMHIFIAPTILGEGLSSVGDFGIRDLESAYSFESSNIERVGDDILFTGFRRRIPKR